MNFLDFNDLTLEEKKYLVEKHGIYLASRDKFLIEIKLYSLNIFFVEVWLTNNEFFDPMILEIIGFEICDLPKIYLKSLHVDYVGVSFNKGKKIF